MKRKIKPNYRYAQMCKNCCHCQIVPEAWGTGHRLIHYCTLFDEKCGKYRVCDDWGDESEWDESEDEIVDRIIQRLNEE